MSDGKCTNRSKWTDEDVEKLQRIYDETPPAPAKLDFWEDMSRRFDDGRGWQSMKHRINLPPKLRRDSCKIHRLYCTLGGTMGELADRYGIHQSQLTLWRVRGWLPTSMVYQMLDDAIASGDGWEERDARELQGIHMDA
ncbi:MAG TPA: hypothetical protein EYN66_09030 [Myxococcales bacterium]|nr:hypothetical protein [Myxococcales bacterium]